MGKILFSTDVAGTTGYPHTKIELATDPISFTKINSEWIVDLM